MLSEAVFALAGEGVADLFAAAFVYAGYELHTSAFEDLVVAVAHKALEGCLYVVFARKAALYGVIAHYALRAVPILSLVTVLLCGKR